MATINPTLTFQGNAEEAFNFYKAAFGGEFSLISKYTDMPPNESMPASEAEKEKVLHVGLPIGKENELMGNDMLESVGKIQVGNNVGISIQAETKEEAERLFAALSEGGKVTMPLQDTFWNAYFGMFTDKFGVHWMINHDYGEKK